MGKSERDSARNVVDVQVKPEKVTRFSVGSRWEVVASSLDSLWQGGYRVTLAPIEDEASEDGSDGRS